MRIIDKMVEGKKLILFGASELGAKTVILELEGHDVAYFCDNNPAKWGTELMGIPIKNPKVLLSEDRNQIVVVITSMYWEDIMYELMSFFDIVAVGAEVFVNYNEWHHTHAQLALDRYESLCAHKNEYEQVYNLLADTESKNTFKLIIENYKNGEIYFGNVRSSAKQYFNEIFADSITENEVYADIGVENGESILDFIQYADNKYKKVYGFEPDPINYYGVCNRFRLISDKVKLVNAALSDFNGETSFDCQGNAASNFSKNGNATVKVLKLDDAIHDQVTFIKMDTEGAEYEILKGAENMIKTNKPKLAISLYHRHEDLWKLPLLIHTWVPEYKFYIKHHTRGIFDTVLYAKL